MTTSDPDATGNHAAQLLEAARLALAGEWDAAHRLVQSHEEDRMAAWIHAVLHKMEGDAENSRYWYHRAGRLEQRTEEPRVELRRILELLGNR